MQALASRFRKAEGLIWANIPLFSSLFRNSIIFLGIFGIAFLYVASGKFSFGPVSNVVAPSILVILATLVVAGKRVLTVTPFDYYFVGYIALAVFSHIFAVEYLYRSLGLFQLQTNIIYVVTIAVLFRAFFCLVYIAPQISSRFFVGALVLVLSFVSALGVVQRFGPGKSVATHIGIVISANGSQVADQAAYSRPTGVFSSPNILGYAACILASVVLGWGFSELSKINVWKTIAVFLLLGLSIVCCIACQSRQSLGVIALTPFAFAIGVKLKSLDPKNSVVLGFLLVIAAFGFTMAITGSKSDYLTSIAKKGVDKDQSFQARAGEFRKLREVSSDIAIGGTGESMSNVNQIQGMIEHSRYNTQEIDSEWGNMFEGFGVGGVVLLALFYVFTARDTRQVWDIDLPEAKTIALVSFVLLAVNLLLTITAVRVSKIETSGFTFEVLGALSAWRIYGIERGWIPKAKARGKRKLATA